MLQAVATRLFDELIRLDILPYVLLHVACGLLKKLCKESTTIATIRYLFSLITIQSALFIYYLHIFFKDSQNVIVEAGLQHSA